MSDCLCPLTCPVGAPRRHTRSPLPPYRHVPGLTPHPVNDPQGHAFGLVAPGHSPACEGLPVSWLDCPEYLFGVDLFNRSFLWEAHEAWELIWNVAGHDTVPGQFLQGLIQVAAGLLRRHLGTPRGAQRLLRKADRRFAEVERWQRSSGQTTYMGLDLRTWRAAVATYAERDDEPYPFLRLER